MKIRVLLQYYFPHISGLSNCAKDIAEFITDQHDVEVLTYQTANAKNFEVLNKVSIKRFHPSIKIGRANFSLKYIFAINKGLNNVDVIHLHLPCPDALFLGYRRLRKHGVDLYVTYQCDSENKSLRGKISSRFLDWSSRRAIRSSKYVVVTSIDYSSNSRLKSLFSTSNLVVIPPCSYQGNLPERNTKSIPRAIDQLKLGFLGRMTSEKGLELLLDAIENIGPNCSLILAGPTENLSENEYGNRMLRRVIDSPNCQHLGLISEDEKKEFFKNIDVLVVPSTNSLEAFGIVQIESISNNTPVVVSNIPGVRTVVQSTGYGTLFNPVSATELICALLELIQNWPDYGEARKVLESEYRYPIPEGKYADLLSLSETRLNN